MTKNMTVVTSASINNNVRARGAVGRRQAVAATFLGVSILEVQHATNSTGIMPVDQDSTGHSTTRCIRSSSGTLISRAREELQQHQETEHPLVPTTTIG